MWTSPLYYQNEALFYIRRFNWSVFWLFFRNSFTANVWPWKETPLFRRRLRAFIFGFSRGFWLVLFPSRLRSKAVRQSTKRERERIRQNEEARA